METGLIYYYTRMNISNTNMRRLLHAYVLSFVVLCFAVVKASNMSSGSQLFHVDGNISLANHTVANDSNDLLRMTKILVDIGDSQGFLRSDGSFRVSLPAGSYVITVANPVFDFQAVLVNISWEGTVSAQTINHLHPNKTSNVTHPLQLQPLGRTKYFQVKPVFNFIDVLKSRVVIMLFLPCIIIFVALKFVDMDDPEVREELNSLDWKQKLPDFPELLSRLFGEKSAKKTAVGKEDKGETDDGPVVQENNASETKDHTVKSDDKTAEQQ